MQAAVKHGHACRGGGYTQQLRRGNSVPPPYCYHVKETIRKVPESICSPSVRSVGTGAGQGMLLSYLHSPQTERKHLNQKIHSCAL